MRLNLEFLFVKKIGDIWPKIGQKSAIFEEMYKNRQIRDFWGSPGDIVKNISGNTENKTKTSATFPFFVNLSDLT